MSWTPPGAQTGYLLVIIPTDGSPLTFRQLAGTDTTTMHTFGDSVVCYQLITQGVAGQTDALCAFPNGSTLAPGSPAGAHSLIERLPNGFDPRTTLP